MRERGRQKLSVPKIIPSQYNDVIISVMASQITSISTVNSTICLSQHKKNQSPRYLPTMVRYFRSLLHSRGADQTGSIYWCSMREIYLFLSALTTEAPAMGMWHTERLHLKKKVKDMMTSSNGNIFRVTGHLCGEFTGPRWIPHTKASDAELWCFLWSPSE